MASLKLQDVRSPLEQFRDDEAAGPAKAPSEPSQKATAAEKPKDPPKRPRRSPTPRGKRARDSKAKEPLYERPLAEQARISIGATMLPALYERLDDLTASLRGEPGPRVSMTRLLIATVHFGMPSGEDEAVELALRWQRLRLGVGGSDPYEGARTRPYTLRLYEGQVELLDVFARALKERHAITGGRSALLNAIVHFEGPSYPAEALRLIRDLEVAVKRLGVAA